MSEVNNNNIYCSHLKFKKYMTKWTDQMPRHKETLSQGLQ